MYGKQKVKRKEGRDKNKEINKLWIEMIKQNKRGEKYKKGKQISDKQMGHTFSGFRRRRYLNMCLLLFLAPSGGSNPVVPSLYLTLLGSP